jgi:cobalt/nickel transport system permease protein
MHFDLTDAFQPRSSRIHALDPRTKVVCTLLFITAVGLAPAGQWLLFAALWAFAVAAAIASGLRPGFAMRKAVLAFPFVLAALPLPFTTPGEPILTIPVLGWEATAEGLARFASLLARTWLAAQGAILLTATTPIRDLLWAMAALRLPRLLVSTIGFMIRYLFVLADEAARMLQARASRAVRLPGRRPSLGWRGWTAGSMVGTLFLRSLERSERVYSAMLSRGYDGRPVALAGLRMRRADWGALFLTSIALLALLLWPHLV